MPAIAMETYQDHFDRPLQERSSLEPAWLLEHRKQAMTRFTTLGIPTTRNEEWRFTPIGPIAEAPFAPAVSVAQSVDQTVVSHVGFADMECIRLTFVDGRFVEDLSCLRPLHAGVITGSLGQALAAHPELLEQHLLASDWWHAHPFANLSAAMSVDGAFVYVPDGVTMDVPIVLLNVATAPGARVANYPRSLLVLGRSAAASVVECYVGTSYGADLTCALTDIHLGPNAQMDHYLVQRQSPTSFHVGALGASISRDGVFSSLSVQIGAAIARNDIYAHMGGENVECTLNGFYLVDGNRLIDSHTMLDHAYPHCNSHQVYKGILSEHGRGVFNGKIMVRQDAQKTDAKQTNQVLLLSDDAKINTKPQLEIFADDVKCTHGATVGQLDSDALFYLRARGIPLEDAESLLVHAFAADVTDRIRIPIVRQQIDETLLARLPSPQH